MSPATLLSSIKQYSGMDIFPAILISHMRFGDIYANREVIFIDLQGANENPAISYSCDPVK